MKGYILTFYDSWSNNRNNFVIGYFMSWNRVINAAKQLQKENIENYKGLRTIYIVIIEPNKINNINNTLSDWICNYQNYKVFTADNNTFLKSNKGKIIDLDSEK